MINNSRREFFKNLVPKQLEFADSTKDKKIITIGHFAAFSVHTKARIKIQNLDLTVEFLPEGIRLRSEDANKNFRLSLSANGLLQAHLSEEWPETAVLSIFTGEIYNI